MTERQHTVTENDIHAYVDGELDDARRREVEAHMAADETDAARTENYRRINDEMHALFDPVLNEGVPPHMITTRSRAPMAAFYRIAAVLALAVGGMAVGWGGYGIVLPSHPVLPAKAATQLAKEASRAHAVFASEVRHPVEVKAGEDSHLVAWLTKRTELKIQPPQLDDIGYRLVGGRLLPSETGPAAQLMYETEGGERLTLFVRRKLQSTDKTAFRFDRNDRNGVATLYWINGPAGYALSGDLPREQLFEIAHMVYGALESAEN